MQRSYRKKAAVVLVLLVLVAAVAWWLQWREPLTPSPTSAVQHSQPSPPPARASGLQAVLRERFPGLDFIRAERESTACEADVRALTLQRWEALASSGQRDHRIAHALLADSYSRTPGTSARLLAGLAAGAPDDAELLWLHATACQPDHGCDAPGAARRMVAAAPDNLAHWLLLIGSTARYPDGEKPWTSQPSNMDELGRLLDAAAQASTKYASHHGEAFLVAYAAMEDLPVPPSCNSSQLMAARRAVAQMGMSGLEVPMDSTGIAIGAATAALTYAPTHHLVQRMCQQPALAPTRLQSCRAVLSRLADGDTLLAQSVGVGAMLGLADHLPAAEADAWRERYRQHRWLMEQYAAQAMHFDSAKILTTMAEGEVASIRAQLAQQGQWPPPVDWQPKEAGKRR